MLGVAKRHIVYSPAEGLPGAAGTSSITISAADMLLYYPTRPVRVVRWGFIATAKISDSGSNTLSLACSLRPEASSASNEVVGATTAVSTQTGYNSTSLPAYYTDLAGGTITVPNSVLTASAGVPIGSMLYHTVWPQTAGTFLTSGGTGSYYPNPSQNVSSAGAYTLSPPGGVSTQFVVYPGQCVAIKVVATAPSTPGNGKFWLEVEEQAFTAPLNNNQLAVTGVPSGIWPTPSDPEHGYTTSSSAFGTNTIIQYNS